MEHYYIKRCLAVARDCTRTLVQVEFKKYVILIIKLAIACGFGLFSRVRALRARM